LREKLFLLVLAVALISLLTLFSLHRTIQSDPLPQSVTQLNCLSPAPTAGATLVVYAHFEKDAVYKENLEMFLEAGVEERDDVDYLFIIQGESLVSFPEYRNLRVLKKTNECLDFGAWSYGLSTLDWQSGKYKHFIFINSSVRGPFVPNYVPRFLHWTQLLTHLLREDGDGHAANGPIKLGGMSINCAISPHVQSMLWATDLEALQYIASKSEIFTCKKSMPEAILSGEVKLSEKILARGWNIASLLVAYRGWDFRKEKRCNDLQDPTFVGTYFGITPGIHETLFVKNSRQLWPKEVKVYTRIARQQAQKGIFS